MCRQVDRGGEFVGSLFASVQVAAELFGLGAQADAEAAEDHA